MDPQTKELLTSIASSLQRIAAAVEPKEELGFGQADTVVTVDCYPLDNSDALWAIYQGPDSPKAPLPNNLRCRLMGAYVSTKETSRGESQKLRVLVRADRVYSLESGLLTQSNTHHYNNFAGSLLASLEVMTEAQLGETIDIYLRSGDEKNAVFATIYVKGQKAERHRNEPAEGTHNAIINRVNKILGYTPPAWTLSPAERIRQALLAQAVPEAEVIQVAKNLLKGRQSSSLSPVELSEILGVIKKLNVN